MSSFPCAIHPHHKPFSFSFSGFIRISVFSFTLFATDSSFTCLMHVSSKHTTLHWWFLMAHFWFATKLRTFLYPKSKRKKRNSSHCQRVKKTLPPDTNMHTHEIGDILDYFISILHYF